MPSMKTIVAATVGLASLAQAHIIKITAQSDGVFHPDTVHPRPGDVLEFHFQAGNHSVVAGDYNNACAPMNLGTGFFSGFFPTEAGDSPNVFRVTINDTEPMAFYSSQGLECAHGMNGMINPNGDKNLGDYKARASSLSMAVSPSNEPFGGEVLPKTSAAYSALPEASADATEDCTPVEPGQYPAHPSSSSTVTPPVSNLTNIDGSPIGGVTTAQAATTHTSLAAMAGVLIAMLMM